MPTGMNGPARSRPAPRDRIAALRERAEGRAAFIAYLTAGDPSAEATVALAAALERAGADVLELGVPFSDPIADGPVLQRAAGAGARRRNDARRRLRDRAQRSGAGPDLALVLFSYLNPLLRRGIERAAPRGAGRGLRRRARDRPAAGGGGRVPAGHPVRRARHGVPRLADFARRADEGGGEALERFPLRRFAAGHDRRPGGLPADLPRRSGGRARRAAGPLPIAVGFGIGTPEAARRAARLADGVIVGLRPRRARPRKPGAGAPGPSRTLARSLAGACRRGR